MRFTANTAQAQAQLKSLQAQIKATQALNNNFNIARLNAGMAGFGNAAPPVKLSGPIKQMDDLTKRIQKGKISQKEFYDTVFGTNKLYEYQNALQKSSLQNVKAFGNSSRGIGRLIVPELTAVNDSLAQQATRWLTAGAAAKSYGRQMMDTGKNMAFMGRQALLSVTGPLALLAGGAAMAFYGVDKQLTNLAKVYGDVDEAATMSQENIRKSARGLSQEMNRLYAISQKDTLDLASSFAALGESGRDLDLMVSASARLMRLGDVSVDSAQKLVTTIRTVFELEGEALEDAINKMNVFENSSTLTMQDFSDGLPRMASVVKLWGGDITQAGMILEAFTRSGIGAVEGANSMKTAFAKIANPTAPVEKLYEEITNTSFSAMSTGLKNNVPKIMKAMDEALKESGASPEKQQEMYAQLFGAHQIAKSLAAAMNLNDPSEAMKKLLEMDEQQWADYAKATADREVAVQMQSVSAQFDQTMNRIKMIAEQAGEAILPVITKSLNFIIDQLKNIYEGAKAVYDSFGPLKPLVKWLAIGFAVAAAAFAPLMLMASAFMLIGGGIVSVFGAAAALMGKMRGKNTGAVFQTGSQRAQALQAKSIEQNQIAQQASTVKLTSALEKLAMTYSKTGSAQTAMAGTMARASDSQASAAARSTSALNLETAAVNRNAAAKGHLLRQQSLAMFGRHGAGVMPNPLADKLSSNIANQKLMRNSGFDPLTGKLIDEKVAPKPSSSTSSFFSANRPTSNQAALSSLLGKQGSPTARLAPLVAPVKPQLIGQTELMAAMRQAATTGGLAAGTAYSKAFSSAQEKNQVIDQMAKERERRAMAGIGINTKTGSERTAANASMISSYNARQIDRAQGQAISMNNARNNTSPVHTVSRDVNTVENRARAANVQIAKMSDKWESQGQKVAGVATAVGMVGTMLGPTNAALNVTLTTLMAISMVTMMFPGIFSYIGAAVVKTGARMTMLGGLIGKMRTGIVALGTALKAAFLPLFLVAGAIAIGVGIYKFFTREAAKLNKEHEKIRSNAEGYAEVMGYTYSQFGAKQNSDGELVDNDLSLAKRTAENEKLKPEIEKMKRESADLQKLSMILESTALKMFATGANPEQVKSQIEAMLNAANIDPEISNKLKIQFNDVTPTGPNGTSLSLTVEEEIRKTFGTNEGNTPGWARQMFSMPGFTIPFTDIRIGFGDTSQGADELSDEALRSIGRLKDNLNNALMGEEDPALRGQYLKSFFDQFQAELDAGLKGMSVAAAASGLNLDGLLKADMDYLRNNLGLDDADIDKLEYQKNVVIKIIEDFKAQDGAADFEFVYDLDSVDAAQARLAQINKTVMYTAEEAEQAYIGVVSTLQTPLDPDEMFKLINMFRQAAGQIIMTREEFDKLPSVMGGQTASTVGGPIYKNLFTGAQDEALKLTAKAKEAEKAVADLEAAITSGAKGDWSVTMTIHTDGGPLEVSAEDLVSNRKKVMENVMKDVTDEMAAEAQIQWDAQKRAFQDQQKAAQDALAERQSAEQKAFDKAQKAEQKGFDAGWKKKIEDENNIYEDRIKAIEGVQEAEDETERIRKRNSERENRRLKYTQSLMQAGVDLNIAMAGGDLDEVARLSANAAVAATDFDNSSIEAEQGYQKEDADRARKSAIDLIKEEQKARQESLEKQKEMEQEAMQDRLEIQREEFARKQKAESDFLSRKQENENIAYEISFQANQRKLNRELDALRTQIPMNEAQLQESTNRVQSMYDAHGVMLVDKSDRWAVTIKESLESRTRQATEEMSNEAMWRKFGNETATAMTRGAMDMSVSEFNDFIRTGDLPGAPVNPAGVFQGLIRHTGGPIGGGDKYNNRAGIPMNAPIQRGERVVLAQDNEFMMRGSAHQKYGTDALMALNEGKADIVRHAGGPVGGGFAGVVAQHQAALMKAALMRTVLATGTAMMDATSGGIGGGVGEPYGLNIGTNISYGSSTGFPPWVRAVEKKFNVQASTYPGHQERDGKNKGIDWIGASGGQEGINEMQRFAEYLATIPGQLEQVIWMNPNTGQKIGVADGQFVGPGTSQPGYYANDWGGHANHVHTRQSFGFGPAALTPAQIAQQEKMSAQRSRFGGWTTAGIEKFKQDAMMKHSPYMGMDGEAMLGEFGGNSETYARDIVNEAKRRGLTKKAAVIGLMTAMQESSMRMLASYAVPESLKFPHDGIGSDHDSIGLFQQRQAGWGTVAQRMNATASAGMFYAQLAKMDYNSMDHGNAAQAVQRSNFPRAYDKWRGSAESLANRLYDLGGIANGKGLMAKGTIKPERVLSPQQTRSFDKLIPMLNGQLDNMGIVGYDGIVKQLSKDAQTAVTAAEAIVRNAYNETSSSIGDIKIDLRGANITGVDELEKLMNQLGDEIIERIAKEQMRKERRLGGR